MTRIRVVDVHKRFGNTVALAGVSIEVEKGELFTLLGPSGCGKTTLLRIIAGFEIPDRGRVYFDDEDVTFVKPDKRGAVMVFQNWALWPHMTVYENVAYGLKLRKMPKHVIDSKVREILKLVGLEGTEDRYPHQLSGGQQQRVALARALVVEPRVLLLDEPLSNLDAKLRIRMREEIRRIQRRLGITTIYVTHDQEEAMAISDRIAVMNRGRVLQIGTPEEVYRSPRNLFVATFVGRSTAFSVHVVEVRDGGRIVIDVEGHRIEAKNMSRQKLSPGDNAVAVIKLEDIDVYSEGPCLENCVKGIVIGGYFLGFVRQYTALVGRKRISFFTKPSVVLDEESEVCLCMDPDRVFVFSSNELEEVGLEELD